MHPAGLYGSADINAVCEVRQSNTNEDCNEGCYERRIQIMRHLKPSIQMMQLGLTDILSPSQLIAFSDHFFG